MILTFFKYCYFWIDILGFLTQTFEPAHRMFSYGCPLPLLENKLEPLISMWPMQQAILKGGAKISLFILYISGRDHLFLLGQENSIHYNGMDYRLEPEVIFNISMFQGILISVILVSCSFPVVNEFDKSICLCMCPCTWRENRHQVIIKLLLAQCNNLILSVKLRYDFTELADSGNSVEIFPL